MIYHALVWSVLLFTVTEASLTPLSERRFDYANEQQEQSHIHAVCEGINTTTNLAPRTLNYQLPCIAITAIEYQCRYGPALGRTILDYYHNDNETGIVNILNSTGSIPRSSSDPGDEVSFSISELPEQSNACNACNRVHGASADQLVGNGIDDTSMSSFSSEYCAVAHTATAPFRIYSFSLKAAAAPVSSESLRGITVPYFITAEWTSSETSLTYSDALGSNADATQIGLYYTPSVTGSKVWIVAEPSIGRGSAGPTQTSMTTSTMSGEIVPTVSPMMTASRIASTKEAQPSSPTETVRLGPTSSSGAMQAYAPRRVVGFVGLARAILLL